MRLLITGVGGFVGATLADEFLKSNAITEIVGIDNFSRSGSELNRSPLLKKGVRIIHGDLRISSDVDSLPPVDWVIDAAANPSVLAGVDGRTSSRQLIENNLLGTVNLLEYCKRHQTGFTLISTSRVYSVPPLASLKVSTSKDAFAPIADQAFPHGISTAGINESFSTDPPVSLYGSTKVASEHLALEYGATFQFPVWVNRCGVLAGAGQFGHVTQGIVSYWIHSFRERSPLRYIGFGGSGYQVRDCMHPRDLVPLLKQQFVEPLNTVKPQVANVAGGIENSFSLAQLSAWCGKRYQQMAITSVKESRPFDIPWMVLDATRASKVWNWQPRTKLNDLFEEIANFADCNPDWLATTTVNHR